MRHLLSGNAAARGSALGRARVRLPHALDVEETKITPGEVEAELTRIHEAVDTVRAEMHDLRQRLHGALAHEVGEFVDLHALLLDDPELLQGIDALIRTGLYSADYALRLQRDRIAAVFEGMDDAYLRSRIDDIDQVIGRLHAALHRSEADLQGVAGEILLLTAIYLVMPAGHLRLKHALIGGIVAALLWEVTRHALVWYFATMSQIGVVYGSFATTIALLLSFEIAATVLLLGAQVIAIYERRLKRADGALPQPPL